MGSRCDHTRILGLSGTAPASARVERRWEPTMSGGLIEGPTHERPGSGAKHHTLNLVELDLIDRHVPVRVEGLEPPLLFLQEPRAVGVQAPLNLLFA